MLTLLLLCSYLSLCSYVEARNPGVILQLSSKGLNYATEVAIDELQKYILNHEFPSFTRSEGHLSYSISRIRVQSFTKPGSLVVTEPGVGVTASLTNLGVRLSGDWSYRYKLYFIPVRDSGTLDVSVNSASVKVSLSMGSDTNGRPTIATRSCQSHASGVSVSFHGGASWIYNMFRSKLEDYLENQINNKLCNSLDELINVRAKSHLQRMKVLMNTGKYLTWDYRLVAPPVFGANYLQTWHKGEVYWRNDQSETPFDPQPIKYPDAKKYLTLCFTDYVVTSAAYVTYTRKLLTYNLTKRDLPQENWRYLDIDAFPKLAKKFPNSTIELHMYATNPPHYRTANKAAEFLLAGKTEFKIRTPKGELVDWFTLGLKAKLLLSVKMTELNITGKVKRFHFASRVIQKQIDPVPKPLIDTIFKFVFRDFIVPQLNGLARKGCPVPHLNHVKYIEPELRLVEGGVCFAVNLKYIP